MLLQVVFHAQIEREVERFTMDDVANDICVKLIHRHPHVFGEVSADTSDKVLSNWEKIKSEEKHRNTITDKLKAIPPMLPALMRAEKVGKKAKCFDFADEDEVVEKIHEEMAELRVASVAGDADACEEEVGDLLLSITSLCRKLSIDPEVALNRATDKFIRRFELLENAVTAEGKTMENLSSEELNLIWNENKHK